MCDTDMSNDSIDDIDIHDAELKSVFIDWKNNKCEWSISGYGFKGKIIFEDVLDIQMPMVNPWGPSDWINGLEILGKGNFEFQMQSGDVVKIKANSCSVIPCDV
jgi:hypothetical protein